MANGIPPFLPATPPPMSELDFYEDDDDDEFGDFSNASETGYHDSAAVSKVSGDNTLNDPKHVFDPGTFNETIPNHNENLTNNTFPNGFKDDSFRDSTHHETIEEPVQELSVQNESSLEINVSELLEKSEMNHIENLNENYIPIDSMKGDNTSFKPTTNHNVEVDLCLNDDDSSITDSISENCDKNVSSNKDNISINFDNGMESDSDFCDFFTQYSIKAEPPLEENSTESFTALNRSTNNEDDFTSFIDSNETSQNNVLNTFDDAPKQNSEQIEQNYLPRGISEDSDDSNIPDINFNCFITCPSEPAAKEIFDDDDFGDFTKPEVDVFDKNSSEDFQTSVLTTVSETTDNFQLNNKFRPHDLKSTTQVTMDPVQVENETIDTDDEFSDFISTTCPAHSLSLVASNDENVNDFSDFVSTKCPAPSQSLVAKNNENVEQEHDDFEPFTDYSEAENLQFKVNISQDRPMPPHSCVDLEKMYDFSAECWNEAFKACAEDQIEVNLNTLEGKLNGSSVWCKIKDIESSPTLSYNWNNSETQKILLSALYVDSRNILFGPRWSSEVPRFASNLGFSPLVPQKASETKDSQPIENLPKPVVQENIIFKEETPSTSSTVPTSVPEAHFDWNNSGLTNPLDSYSHSSLLDLDLLASFDIHSPYYKKNRKNERTRGSSLQKTNPENSLLALTPQREELSEEAKEVLKNLPNLYVMEKQYIVFPKKLLEPSRLRG